YRQPLMERMRGADGGRVESGSVGGAARAKGDRGEAKEKGEGKGDRGGVVPVVLGGVVQRDVPIFLSGIGTVQGYNTVTVRARVDGHLERVEFGEGEEVQAGQVLARLDARPFQAVLDQALAKKKQDEALLANASRDLEREQTLLAEKAGTAQRVDTQRALVEQLQATLLGDEAAIEAARVQLDYTTLRAPVAGRTGIRMVDQGNVVRASDATGVVVITQMQPIALVFTLSEQHLGAVQAGRAQSGEPLLVQALGRDNTTLLATGTLSVVDNQIDSTTGTIRLKAVFANEERKLWPGQFVNVRLRVAIREGALVVPVQAVQRGPKGTYVFVVQGEDTVEMRMVGVGRMEDGWAVVEEGLQAGERVVVDGHYRLVPGAKVRAVEPVGGGRARGGEKAKGESPRKEEAQPPAGKGL
ncbi:MAG: hypothetical protein RLZZ142_1951, partial [Verrucomicrobiota bacterium]